MVEVHTESIFANRQDAGRALAAQLADLADAPDVVVLGLPRGGVPVAAEVAAAIGASLDVIVVRKIGAPAQPELALGAIASGGTIVRNDDIIRALGVSDAAFAQLATAERAVVDERDASYRRGERDRVPVSGRAVVVVDDGLATGATMRVALHALRAQGASTLIAAAPVAPEEMRTAFAGVADRVEIVATPANFAAVGSWYADFRQVDDDEVSALLSR